MFGVVDILMNELSKIVIKSFKRINKIIKNI